MRRRTVKRKALKKRSLTLSRRRGKRGGSGEVYKENINKYIDEINDMITEVEKKDRKMVFPQKNGLFQLYGRCLSKFRSEFKNRLYKCLQTFLYEYFMSKKPVDPKKLNDWLKDINDVKRYLQVKIASHNEESHLNHLQMKYNMKDDFFAKLYDGSENRLLPEIPIHCMPNDPCWKNLSNFSKIVIVCCNDGLKKDIFGRYGEQSFFETKCFAYDMMDVIDYCLDHP